MKQGDVLILKNGDIVNVCCPIEHKYLFPAIHRDTKKYYHSTTFNSYEVAHNMGQL